MTCGIYLQAFCIVSIGKKLKEGTTMCENKEFAMDKQELADDMLDQVAGGAAEGEIQVMYCARDCKCSREFKCDANGKWVCMTCGKYRGSINVFA